MNANSKPMVVFSAGGKGTRIKSVNSEVPKPMIPIAGKPILEWGVEELVKQGYKDFIITVSYKSEMITKYFGDGSKWNCNIAYYYEKEPLGNAGALFKLMEEKRIEGEFLFFIADAIFSIDCDKFVQFHRNKHALASLFVHPNSHPYDSGLVLVDASTKIVRGWLNKEDDRPEWYSNQVNAGLQILSTDLLRMSNISPCDVGTGDNQRKVDLDRDILKPLVKTNRIFAYNSTEYCKDAGTPERFFSVERDILNGRVTRRNSSMKQKTIFLDRDGVINKYNGYITNLEDFELLPMVAESIGKINLSDYLTIVVTNQPVIARGEVSADKLKIIHNKMETLLGKDGAYIDGIYVCPHHPDKGFAGEVPELKIDCDCRKPKPGMLFKAAEDYNISLDESWMIGDSWRDIVAGKAAGCKTILVGDNISREREVEVLQQKNIYADREKNNLFEAVEEIIGR